MVRRGGQQKGEALPRHEPRGRLSHGESHTLLPLPPYIPPVYQTLYRTVDLEGFVHVDTNRYSVPERLIGREVEVHKPWDRIEVFFKNQKVADHPRLIDKRETKVTAPGHHGRSTARGPMKDRVQRGEGPLRAARVA